MARVVEVLFAIVTLPALVFAGFAWVYIRRLRRPILLSPQSAFKPPLRWRWSLSQAAIYHRRLVLALRTARATATSVFLGSMVAAESPVKRALGSGKRAEVGWEGVLGELEAVAVGIDRRLLGLEREPREVRRRMAGGFEHDVSEVEQASASAVEMFQSWQRSLPQGSVSSVTDRLGALSQAMQEIRELQEPADQAPAATGSGTGELRDEQ